METRYRTLIVGAGVAGLACAVRLVERGAGELLVVEATDRVGGRVRTDHRDGYTFDHGFQVLLTAYPACRQLLDYDMLRLRAFEPGALVRHGGRFQLLGDPWRRPTEAISTALTPVGSLGDKLRVARLRHRSRSGSLEDLYRRPQTTTLDRLRSSGFSPAMIEEFFRPFLGGVYLDESLRCPSRMLEFVFRMFAEGDIAIPAEGMSAIPRQLADRLPRGTLKLGDAVTRLESIPADQGEGYRVQLSSGEALGAERVVIAVESDAAARLLGADELATPWSGTTTLYYAADPAPDRRKRLMLRGDEKGVVQTAVVLSNVAPEYAPPGKALVSVSVDAADHDPETGDTEPLDREVRQVLGGWFGEAVNQWKLLSVYRVPFGLPRIPLDPVLSDLQRTRLCDHPVPRGTLFVCGDHRETPSIQGAMNSGLRVAEQLLSETPTR